MGALTLGPGKEVCEVSATAEQATKPPPALSSPLRVFRAFVGVDAVPLLSLDQVRRLDHRVGCPLQMKKREPRVPRLSSDKPPFILFREVQQ